jgi:hypothetical protein
MSTLTPPIGSENLNLTNVSDRRRSERVPMVLEAWICSPTSSDPVNDRTEVTAVNLSRHGVGFVSSESVAVGTFFNIHIIMGTQQIDSGS